MGLLRRRLESSATRDGPRLLTMLRSPRKSLFIFALWLAAFYVTWFAIVNGGHYWAEVTARWPIATGMLLGSYVAGSTPMGGGTVGFPVLVLLLDFPATIGRSFGLAIQSIGMVSATIFLLCRRQPIAWFLLRPAIFGATAGMPLGLYCISPLVGDSAVKLVFAVVWCSFGMLLIRRRHEFDCDAARTRVGGHSPRLITLYGLAAGVTGGLLAAITGVGIDMILYAVLTLRFGIDLKVSIPTSVVAMAFTSVLGTLCLTVHPTPSNGGIPDEVFYSWLAAAPVVALGAPLGSWVVQLLPRKPTLFFVGGLCLVQFVWTLYAEKLTLAGILFACVSVGVSIGLMYWLSYLGKSAQAISKGGASRVAGGLPPEESAVACDFDA